MAPAAYSSFFFHIPQGLPHTPPPAAASHLRSFLSLDIADSVLSRSSSMRSTDSDSTAYSFIEDKPRRSRTPARNTPSPASSSSSSSQRPLPKPKPAPSARIPATPSPRRAARSQDAPRRTPRPRSPAPPLPPVRPPRPASIMTGTSTASTHYRHVKRTDALARLEGRAAPPPRPVSPPPYSPYAAVHRTKSAAPVLATKSFMPLSEADSDSDDYDFSDADDVHVELISVPSSPDIVQPPARKGKKGRSRAGTIESWFVGPPPASAPPAPRNFMDFGDFDVYDRPKPYALI